MKTFLISVEIDFYLAKDIRDTFRKGRPLNTEQRNTLHAALAQAIQDSEAEAEE